MNAVVVLNIVMKYCYHQFPITSTAYSVYSMDKKSIVQKFPFFALLIFIPDNG
jgi:hypothetical protein